MADEPIVTAKNVDLSNCDREQIQFPAATLDHGFLLVLKEPELVIVQAGANAAEFLGGSLEGILGCPIDGWLSLELLESLRNCIARSQADGPPVHVGRPSIREKTFDLLVHRCGSTLMAEFELRSAPNGFRNSDLYTTVHTGIARLQLETTMPGFLNLAATQIRAFTGFDRVMVYQFLEDGSGAVRGESVAEGWEPFLGLHYPASDIPLPARRLFKLTWLRHQPDIDYTPVPIVPEINPLTGQPLDLSYAVLRSVSVMYSQYLKNMGTRASMVMTLLKNGELWGLIACHHHSGPRHVPFENRAACEFLAHMVSLLLSGKDDQEDNEYRLKLQAVYTRFVSALGSTSDLLNALVDHRPNLLDYIHAGGAALVVHDMPTLLGATPGAEEVQRLVEWLAAADHHVFSTDCLSARYAQAAGFTAVASGLLAIRIGSSRTDYLLWFRPEFEQTVRWAGDPHKPVDISDDGLRLFPRTSFAIWKETVRGRSRPWKAVEIRAARDLQEPLLEMAVRKAEQLHLLYQNLQRTNAELDAFAYIASHDLKEPLRGIHNYSQFLLEDIGEAVTADAVDKLRTVIRLTRRMDDLLDGLLHYARLGRQGMEIVSCDLNQLVAEVLDTLSSRIREAEAEVRVLGPLPFVSADAGRLAEVFMNLIVNAVKYNDRKHKLVEIGCKKENGEMVLFVRDNGIGIASEHQETIFAIFRRLHPPDQYGGGTGAGLTITRKILERHGGRIWVESEPGIGSTFLFTLGQIDGSKLGNTPDRG